MSSPDQLSELHVADREWAMLSRFYRLVARTEERIARDLERCEQPVVNFSGGKDSQVLVHLVTKQRPDIVCIFTDGGAEYPDTYACVKATATLLNLNLFTLQPRPNLWELYERGGKWAYQQQIGVGDFKEEILVKPSQAFGATLWPAMDGQFFGLRAEESRKRRMMLRGKGSDGKVRGDSFIAGYDGMWHFNPLLDWTAQDVWAYIISRELPYNRVYDCWLEPSERNGLRVASWMCVTGAQWGTFAWLRRWYPDLYNRFSATFPMVREYS